MILLTSNRRLHGPGLFGSRDASVSGSAEYFHARGAHNDPGYVNAADFQPLDEFTLEGIVSPWREEGKAAFYRQMAQADSMYTDKAQVLYSELSVPTLILWGGRISGFC